MLAVLLTWFWFAGGVVISAGNIQGIICSADPKNAPSAMCLENIADWQGVLTVDALRNGRKGVALVAIAWYCLYVFSSLVVCSWTAEDVKTDVVRQADYERVTQPLLLSTTFSTFILAFLILSQTHFLQRNCWNGPSV